VVDAQHGGSDEDLLEAARAGDAESLEALVLRYQPRVFRFGLKMCRDREDAGDIVQETLLTMARSLRDFRGDATLSTWLYAIARSFCLKKRRRSMFAPARDESLDELDARRHGLAEPAPDPERAAFGREVQAALAAAIDALDDGHREVLLLRDVEGLSAPEVAAVTGLSVEAVKSRLHRARLAVRRRVAPLVGRPVDAASSAGCPDVLGLFSHYLDGEITPDACAQMEAHLERCGHCRSACESLKRTIVLCRSTPTQDVPLPVARAVRDAIRSVVRQQADGRHESG
jgi:RNA polymerase sigma-70 factor (ECF subfamily)